MEKIAIIGISCLLPGADTMEKYYDNLIKGKDLRSDIDTGKMGVDPDKYYVDKKGVSDRFYCRKGGFIRDFEMTADDLNLDNSYLSDLDDVYRWSLYTAREALRDSGYLGKEKSLERCGNVIANLSFPTKLSNHLYLPLYRKELESTLQELFDENSFRLKDFKENRTLSSDNLKNAGKISETVSRALSLKGVNFCLDAACASSIYSVKVACDYLLSGREDMMLAGAVSSADPFFINMGFSIFQAYPENEQSNPLDQSSKGLFSAEGAGMFVLKRYSDALKDGDKIYSVIHGIGLSNDGRGQSVLTPSSKGQVLSFERAYENSGISPEDVTYVECHATGTPLGDKIEISSMDQFFGRYKKTPKIGSVKSNLGHLLTAAGVAGIIKVILSLENGAIPKTINLTSPHISENGAIKRENYVESNYSFESSKKIAAVSGFGFGGTNGHIVLERKNKSEIEGDKDRYNSYKKIENSPVAVIGYDCHFGSLSDVRKFEDAVLNGKNDFKDVPSGRWMGLEKNPLLLKEYGFSDGKAPKGSFVEDFDLDFFRFKIPPNPDDSLIPQQLLILKVADRALRRTKIKKGSNTAVIIAMGTETELHRFRGRVNLATQMEESFLDYSYKDGLSDLTEICKDSIHNAAKVNQYTSFIGNIMASRLSSVWDFTGPSFTVSAEELSVFRALEYGKMLLNSGEVDAVVVGGIDLCAGMESVLLRTKENGVFTPGEGAGAIVLKRPEKAKEDFDDIYCEIEDISFSDGDILRFPEGATLFEHSTSEKGTKRFEKAVSNLASDVIKGSVISNVGDCNAASAMASLIKTIILTGEKGFPKEKRALIYGETKALSSSTITIKQSEVKSGFKYDLKDEGKTLIKKVSTCRKDIKDIILTDENKKKFKNFIESKIDVPGNIVEKESVIPEVFEPNSQSGKGTVNPMIKENMSLVTEGHIAFLEGRDQAAVVIYEMIKSMINEKEPEVTFEEAEYKKEITVQPVQELVEHKAEVFQEKEIKTSDSFVPNVKEEGVIWDEKDLLEFAGGKVANVFGSEYSVIDTYKRCVRLPLPPYLLVTRVTELDAKRGEFKPSKMTTEYDIPRNSWYGIDGQIPWAVSVESGQCDLLLISYIGIDFECKGDRVYRLLDCTLTFLDDIPMEGDTLRYDISINSYARNGGSLLFFFSYECFVGDKMVLKMDGGCAGFFTDEELDAGKGIIKTEEELEERKKIVKRTFTPFLNCSKKRFERDDLLQITNGNPSLCFGESYDQKGLNPSLRFATDDMLMIDRVVDIDINGGAYGLGTIHAEKILKPDHWYFPCHFKDDEVMAGSLMSEGCGQLLQFFLLYLGMQTKTFDARFQPIADLPQKVRCRGQVVPVDAVLEYRLEIKEIGVDPYPYAIADIDIILDDRIVVDFKNLGVQIKEKSKDDLYKIEVPDIPEMDVEVKKELYTKEQLENFATGSLEVCFGEKYRIYEGRHAPRTPNGDLQLISRVLDFKGEPLNFENTAEVTTEYDVPYDAWFFRDNSNASLMPYSVIMEIALQPCGFVSCAMETTLLYPDTDFYFRNLDGKGTLLKDIDLRGKTITNRSRLLTTSSMTNTIIQSFDFELSVDGVPFYKGDAVFGYFVAGALKNQVGLDAGVDNHPLTEKKYLMGSIRTIDMDDNGERKDLFEPVDDKPLFHLSKNQLDFINGKIQIDGKGGENQIGYIYAEKKIKKSDWYFKYHFFEDPVMPGSLGIETMLQAIGTFILDQNLAKNFNNPKFDHSLSETKWCYRGQINPEVDKMAIELHITSVTDENGKLTVTADGSLWKEKIRIYEAKDLSVSVVES